QLPSLAQPLLTFLGVGAWELGVDQISSRSALLTAQTQVNPVFPCSARRDNMRRFANAHHQTKRSSYAASREADGGCIATRLDLPRDERDGGAYASAELVGHRARSSAMLAAVAAHVG